MNYSPRALAGLMASVASYNRIAGTGLRIQDAPFVGQRTDNLIPVPMMGEYPLSPGQTVTGISLQDGYFVGLTHYGPRGPLDGVQCHDFEIVRSKKWASRSYRHRTSNRFEFYSVCDVADEHGHYHNLAGGGRTDLPCEIHANFFMENIASQGLQFVQRSNEQGFDFTADMKPGGAVIVRDGLMRNIGSGWGDLNRASYAISIFGRELQTADGRVTIAVVSAEQDVLVRRTLLDNSMQTTPHKDGATSHGALYIGAHPRALVQEFSTLMGVTDRPVAKFEDVHELAIVGSFFHAAGGQVRIQIDRCPNLKITGCKGNVTVQRDGKDLGPIDRLTI